MNMLSDLRRNRLVAIAAAAVAGFLLSVPLRAGAASEMMAMEPMIQNFAAIGAGSTQQFRIHNFSGDAIEMAFEVATREMTPSGREVNAATRDFEVSPSTAVVAAGATQTVTLTWRGTSAPQHELAYRLIAAQQPNDHVIPAGTRAVRFAMRYVGALYVTPSGAESDVVVQSAAAVVDGQKQRRLELVVNNRGRAHALLQQPELTVSAGGTSQTLTAAALTGIVNENILAQSVRRFVIAWPDGLPFEQPTAELRFANAQ